VTDEHESMHERRGGHRRFGDLEAVVDVRVLRQEIEVMRQREVVLAKQIDQLDAKLTRLESQLSGAKGVLYGAGAIVASFVFLVGDKLKAIFD